MTTMTDMKRENENLKLEVQFARADNEFYRAENEKLKEKNEKLKDLICLMNLERMKETKMKNEAETDKEATKNNIDTSLRSELIEMFGDDKVYFRDSKIINGITERFKNTHNTICFVCCEGGTEKHLDYYSNYWGSADLRGLKKKYAVCYEWEDNCVASFHYESVADNEN